jgi:hypothetical protein
MAFTQEERVQHKKRMDAFIEKRRPPEHIRDQLDLSYRIEEQSIVIFEIRPQWNDPQSIVESPVAKTTWVKSRKVWKIYWMPSDLKWHLYPPLPEVDSLQEFINEVDADSNHCFFG